MFKNILAKIAFFGAFFFGFCLLSGCSQSAVGPIPQQVSPPIVIQPKQIQVQVNTTTRAS